jgi:ribosomal-protein-alanine N-acetyltransferase
MTSLKIPNQLITDRLILRMFDLEEDIDAYAAILGQKDVGKWLPKRDAYNYEESKDMIKFFTNHWEINGFGTWAMTTKDGTLLGHMGLNLYPDLKEIEVLYALGEEAWGKGYATEGAKASLEFAFQYLNCEKLIGLTKPDNFPSQHVLEKLGMKHTKDIHWRKMDLYYFEVSKSEVTGT